MRTAREYAAAGCPAVAVETVEAALVDVEQRERHPGRVEVDDAAAVHLGPVTHPP